MPNFPPTTEEEAKELLEKRRRSIAEDPLLRSQIAANANPVFFDKFLKGLRYTFVPLLFYLLVSAIFEESLKPVTDFLILNFFIPATAIVCIVFLANFCLKIRESENWEKNYNDNLNVIGFFNGENNELINNLNNLKTNHLEKKYDYAIKRLESLQNTKEIIRNFDAKHSQFQNFYFQLMEIPYKKTENFKHSPLQSICLKTLLNSSNDAVEYLNSDIRLAFAKFDQSGKLVLDENQQQSYIKNQFNNPPSYIVTTDLVTHKPCVFEFDKDLQTKIQNFVQRVEDKANELEAEAWKKSIDPSVLKFKSEFLNNPKIGGDCIQVTHPSPKSPPPP